MSDEKPSDLDKAAQAATVFGPLLIELAKIFADAVARIHEQGRKPKDGA